MMEIVLKTTVVLAAILAACTLMTRASAAARHLMLALGIAAVLVLPLVAATLPSIDLPLLPAPSVAAAAPERAIESSRKTAGPTAVPLEVVMTREEPRRADAAARPLRADAPAGGSERRIGWLPLLWLAGVVVVAGRALTGWTRMVRLAARAKPVESARILALAEACRDRLGLRTLPPMRIGGDVHVPMLWGFARPALFLPEDALAWSEERLRVVLLHELAHLRRFDGLALLLGRVVTALHWFNPLAWLADARARRECELACDDVVLECGERPSSYARHLLEIASGLPASRPEWASALAVVGHHHFEGRVRSILRAGRSRGLGRFGATAAAVAVALVLGFVATARLSAGEPSSPPEAQEPVPESSILLAQNDLRAREQRKEPRSEEAERAGERAFERAYELHSEERFAEAIDAFVEAVEHGYRVPTAMYNAACGHARLGHADEAVDWLSRALERGFDADYLFEDSDLDPIRADPGFRALLESAVAADDSGKLAVRRDRQEEAALQYDALVAGNSQNGEAWYEVGTDLLALRDFERAMEALGRAVDLLGPDATSAIYNLACAHTLQGHETQALDALERAVLAGFDSEERFENDSDLSAVRQTARFGRIQELHRKLSLGRFEGDWDWTQYSTTRWAPAVKEFREFTRENPDVGRGWFNLGWALHFSHQHAEAAGAFERAAELGFRTATSSYNVACAHAKAGRTDDALDWLERAIDAGFDSGGHLWSDDDLDSLHGNPRFEELRKRVEDEDASLADTIELQIHKALGALGTI